MEKAPASQFYWGDLRRDTEYHLMEWASRGIWVEMLSCMHFSKERGKLEGTPEQLSRLLGCTVEEFRKAKTDISVTKTGDVIENNGVVTIINRRMEREEKEKASGRKRMNRFREKGGGDPDKWTAIKIPILERDNKMCAYCGRRADTVDHVVPKTKGGDENPLNLVACCKRCNMKKGNRTLKEAEITFWEGYLNQEVIKHNTISNTEVTPPSSFSSSSSSPSNLKEQATAPFTLPSKEEIQEASDVMILGLVDKVSLQLYKEKIFSDVNAFKNKMLKEKKNPRSILHTFCRAYLKREFEEGPWGYCLKIIGTESAKYNARDYGKTVPKVER